MFPASRRRQAGSVAQKFNTLLTKHTFLFCLLFSWRDSCNIWAHIEASYVILGKCITQMFGFSVYQFEYVSPSVEMLCSALMAVTRKLALLLDAKFRLAFQHPSCSLTFLQKKKRAKCQNQVLSQKISFTLRFSG